MVSARSVLPFSTIVNFPNSPPTFFLSSLSRVTPKIVVVLFTNSHHHLTCLIRLHYHNFTMRENLWMFGSNCEGDETERKICPRKKKDPAVQKIREIIKSIVTFPPVESYLFFVFFSL